MRRVAAAPHVRSTSPLLAYGNKLYQHTSVSLPENSESVPDENLERICGYLKAIIAQDQKIQLWMQRQPLDTEEVLEEGLKILKEARFDFEAKLNQLDDARDNNEERAKNARRASKQSGIVKLGGGFLVCGVGVLLLLLIIGAIKWTGLWPKLPLWPFVIVSVTVIGLGGWLLWSGVHSQSKELRSSQAPISEEQGIYSTLLDQLRSLILIPALEALSPPHFVDPADDEVLITDAPYLSQRLQTTGGQIETATYRAILTNLGRVGGATIGLAGTRGVGKSELLRTFCEQSDPLTINNGRTIGVLIPAPVVYEPASFLRMIIRRLAEAVPGYDDARSGDRKTREPSPLDIAGLLLCALLFVGGVGLLTGVTNTDRDILAWILIVVGAATSAIVVLFRFVLPPRSVRHGTQPVLGALELSIARLAHNAPSPVSRFALHAFRRIFVRNWEMDVEHWEAMSPESVAQDPGAPEFQDPQQPQESEQNKEVRLESLRVTQLKERLVRQSLAKDAVGVAQKMRYVETRSQSMEASASFKGAGLTSMSGMSLEQIPLTEADLVLELAQFVAKLNENGYQVRIGIDELDKLEAGDDAERFLTGITALFPIRDCSFLLTISQNAAAQFARRGMPVRDVFDSSLDCVIVVQPISFAEARRMVRSRFPPKQPEKMSDTQILLCYCLSGGLPRDCLRYCQRLGELNSLAEGHQRLGQVLPDLLSLELRTRLDGIRHSLISGEGDSKDVFALQLEKIEEAFDSRQVGALFAPFLESDGFFKSLCLGNVEEVDNAPDRGDSDDGWVQIARRQVYSYLLFIETVREAFGKCTPITNAKPATVVKGFEQLSDARRRLETDTAAAWRRTVNARLELGLSELPSALQGQ
jgi:hypothetical protein